MTEPTVAEKIASVERLTGVKIKPICQLQLVYRDSAITSNVIMLWVCAYQGESFYYAGVGETPMEAYKHWAEFKKISQ